MLVNLALSVLPSVFTKAMLAMEMPAAINPYSMAVAPDSFFRNATILDIGYPCWVVGADRLGRLWLASR
jgi:hypothetical protein